MSEFSQEEVQQMLDNLDNFSEEEVLQIEKMVDGRKRFTLEDSKE